MRNNIWEFNEEIKTIAFTGTDLIKNKKNVKNKSENRSVIAVIKAAALVVHK